MSLPNLISRLISYAPGSAIIASWSKEEKLIFGRVLVEPMRQRRYSVYRSWGCLARRLSCSVVVLLWALSASGGRAGSPTNVDTITAEVQRAIATRESYETWRGYFTALSRDQLRELVHSDDDSIAITAAWELFVVRQEGRKGNAIDASGAAKFCDFCRSRLGVTFPAWYERVLATGTTSQDTTTFAKLPEEGLVTYLTNEIYIVTGDQISATEKGLHFAGPRRSLKLPLDRVKPPRLPRPYGVAFSSAEDKGFVSAFHIMQFEYPLTCYGRRGQIWTNEVWCTRKVGYSGTDYFHLADVLQTDKAVYAIGIGTWGVYIEGFELFNGNPVMRFWSSQR